MKNIEQNYFLEPAYIPYDINPLSFVSSKEESDFLISSFNQLPEFLRRLILEHIINHKTLIDCAVRHQLKTYEINELLDEGLLLLRDLFINKYYM